MDLAPDRTLDDLDDETTYDTAVVAQLQLSMRTGVLYLDGGWGRLVESLAAVATGAGAVLASGRAVSGISHDGDRFEVSTAACLDLAVRSVPRTRFVLGLDQPWYLSVHSPPADLAPPGGSVVHVLRYGARSSVEDRPELWGLAERAGIGEADVVNDRFLHRMVVEHGLPKPGEGLAGRPPVEVAHLPGVFLAGDWVGPVGLLADASLASGYAAGDAALHRLEGAAAVTGAR